MRPDPLRADLDAISESRLFDRLLGRQEFRQWRGRMTALRRTDRAAYDVALHRAGVALEDHLSVAELDRLVRGPGTVERGPTYWAEERGTVTRARGPTDATIGLAAGALACRLVEGFAAADDLASAEVAATPSAARAARYALRQRRLPHVRTPEPPQTAGEAARHRP